MMFGKKVNPRVLGENEFTVVPVEAQVLHADAQPCLDKVSKSASPLIKDADEQEEPRASQQMATINRDRQSIGIDLDPLHIYSIMIIILLDLF